MPAMGMNFYISPNNSSYGSVSKAQVNDDMATQYELTFNNNVVIMRGLLGGESYGSDTVTATANTGYVFDHWLNNGNEYKTGTVTLNRSSYDVNLVAVFVVEGGGTVTQTINLTAGHNYLVFTEGDVADSSITGNVLSIANDSKIDLIDLGAGTDTNGEPKVTIVCSSGVYNGKNFAGGGQ